MYSKTKCKAGGYIAYSNPAKKELGPLMHVSENPLRRHNHSPDDHKIDNILLSQELYAEAEKFDQKTNYQKFNDYLRHKPNGTKVTYKKKASNMYKRSLKKHPKNPKSFEEFHEGLLNHEELGKYFKKIVTNKDGKIIGFVFGNEFLMSHAKKNCKCGFEKWCPIFVFGCFNGCHFT